MDARLLEILVCPVCKGPLDCPLCKASLELRKAQAELVCKPCRLAYPVKDDIPMMLEGEARSLSADTPEQA